MKHALAENLVMIAELTATRTTGAGVSRAEGLASHFEISVRTVYRYIAYLQASGLPIEGEPGVGYILRPGCDLPAVTFTFEQLDALRWDYRSSKSQATWRYPKPRLRSERVASGAARRGRAQARKPADVFEPAGRSGGAVRKGRAPRRSRYQGPAAPVRESGRRALSTPRQTARHVAVHRWRAFRELVRVAGDFRAFRLDRITTLEDTDESFTSEPKQDLEACLAA